MTGNAGGRFRSKGLTLRVATCYGKKTDKYVMKGNDEESTFGKAFQRTLQKLGEAEPEQKEHGFTSCAPSA